VTFNADTTGALDQMIMLHSLGFYGIYLHAGSNYTSGTLASNHGQLVILQNK
jgi:hypothetical protein